MVCLYDVAGHVVAMKWDAKVSDRASGIFAEFFCKTTCRNPFHITTDISRRLEAIRYAAARYSARWMFGC
jgi:hypothetical protein